MLNKQQKERLTAAERAYWKDDSMVKHCVNKALLLLNLRGKMFVIEKRNIETRFCFGYRDYGNFNYDDAQDMAAHARRSELYFTRENHRRAGYSDIIRDLNDSNYVVYARPQYIGDCPDLYEISFMDGYEYKYKGLPQGAFTLTADEITAYKKQLTEACKMHHRKITAYLKRYGLSKVNSWTYWMDE